jgi:hypothetical protein
VVAEYDHDFATGARGLLLQLLEASDDLQGIRATVGDIAELDEGRFSARPAAVRADQAGRPRDRRPGGIIAVQVADGDDPLWRGGEGGYGKEREEREQQGRRPDDPMEQGTPPPKSMRQRNVSLCGASGNASGPCPVSLEVPTGIHDIFAV